MIVSKTRHYAATLETIMFEILILITGFVFITLVNPVLGIVLSLITSLSGPVGEILRWAPAAHNTEAAAYLAQFV